MKYREDKMSKNAYLILENGMVFKGKAFGKIGEITGEVVFTTAMTGYLETITDPSYYGQMVVQTFPLIGNYGVIPEDFESTKPQLKAYIVKEWCQEPSNFRSVGTLDTFLKEQGIIGLWGIDTRQLTKVVREAGVMNGKIVSDLQQMETIVKEIKDYEIIEAVKNVSRKEEQWYRQDGNKHQVVLWDFGAKENILRSLLKNGCDVVVVPENTTAKRIMELNPQGIMLSNGPGDPVENTGIILELKKLMEKNIPIFGICLGHQLLALAAGAKTERLKYGHRGANQPALEVDTGRIYITSQNHGYAVVSNTLPKNAKVSFVNVNDRTCEGIEYVDRPIFSVQFHPEACGGPQDTQFLFQRFVELMEENKNALK